MTIKNRVERLEKAKGTDRPPKVIVLELVRSAEELENYRSPRQAEIDAEMAKRPERKDEPITILRWADGHFEEW